MVVKRVMDQFGKLLVGTRGSARPFRVTESQVCPDGRAARPYHRQTDQLPGNEKIRLKWNRGLWVVIRDREVVSQAALEAEDFFENADQHIQGIAAAALTRRTARGAAAGLAGLSRLSWLALPAALTSLLSGLAALLTLTLALLALALLPLLTSLLARLATLLSTLSRLTVAVAAVVAARLASAFSILPALRRFAAFAILAALASCARAIEAGELRALAVAFVSGPAVSAIGRRTIAVLSRAVFPGAILVRPIGILITRSTAVGSVLVAVAGAILAALGLGAAIGRVAGLAVDSGVGEPDKIDLAGGQRGPVADRGIADPVELPHFVLRVLPLGQGA